MKTAVLISGEFRFLEECLPTMKFINEDVDVYVSTWSTTTIKNDFLGIDIKEDVTEERIRRILPNATILIESPDCFQSRKYNDRMIHRWISGWNMIVQSGKMYDALLVTRPDLYFVGEYRGINLDDDCQFAWFDSTRNFLQDTAFLLRMDTARKFFSNLSVNLWVSSTEGDWHAWFYNFFTNYVSTQINRFYPIEHSVFLRPTNNADVQDLSIESVNKRQYDWRDSKIITFIEENPEKHIKIMCEMWGEQLIKNVLLTFKANRLKRISENDTLVIFSGKCRNYEAGILSLRPFKNTDVAVVCWESNEARQFADAVRANHVHLFHEQFHIHNDKCSASANNQKMLALWKKSAEIFKDLKYEYFVLTKPDAFILTDKDQIDVKTLLQSNNLSAITKVGETLINDKVLIFSKKGCDDLIKLCDAALSFDGDSNNVRDIHDMLYQASLEVNVSLANDFFANSVKDVVIQRDNYTPLLSDEYDKCTYLSILSAAITWWRNTNKDQYCMSTDALIHTLK